MIEDRRKHMSDHANINNRRFSFGSPSSQRRATTHGTPSQMYRDRSSTVPNSNPTASLTSELNDRPLPPRPGEGRISSTPPSEVRLPIWQPDEEISKCPICATSFTFWHRKHHCRKCGRVVCANCSPHRITIPRQFIVHPPDTPGMTNATTKGADGTVTIDLTNNASSSTANNTAHVPSEQSIDPTLGGGQEVRLCNPCVPDPNPLPYQSSSAMPVDAHMRRSSVHSGRDRRENHSLAGLSGSPPFLTSRMPSSRVQRYRPTESITDFNATLPLPPSPNPSYSHPSRQRVPLPPQHIGTVYGSAPGRSDRVSKNPLLSAWWALWAILTGVQDFLDGLLQRHRPSAHSHRHHASLGQAVPDPGTFRGSEIPHNLLRQPVPPRPQLREEDECPICHGALPLKGPDGSEVAREQHVAKCVESHFSSSSQSNNRSIPASATNAAVAASAATPSQAAGRPISHQQGALSEDHGLSILGQRRRRTTGMVVYNATEKDCVGLNGEGEAECVICFEEFTIGTEMGRLECLCKFHRKCIRQWWDTKGPGQCPVHQQADQDQ